MFAKLSGVIDTVTQNSLILDVSGVGYLIQASPRTLSKIGSAGDTVSLLIDTHVREDAINLFGFLDQAEQEWFRLLNSVQGVGAKAGFSILAVCPPEQLGFAIASGDKAALTRADGVGPKLASRILTELKDKATKIDLGAGATGGVNATDIQTPKGQDTESDTGVANDAVSALVNLGYGRTDAYSAVMQAQQKANDNDAANLQALIRMALKELSQ